MLLMVEGTRSTNQRLPPEASVWLERKLLVPSSTLELCLEQDRLMSLVVVEL